MKSFSWQEKWDKLNCHDKCGYYIYIVYAYETNLKGHKINRKYLYLVCEKNIKCFFDIVCEKQRFIGINPST